jgi:hypothetical protein
MLPPVRVERELRTVEGRLRQVWAFYLFDDGRLVLDSFDEGMIAPGKRKPARLRAYERLGRPRHVPGYIPRPEVPLPPDVRDEALALVRSFIRFSED